MESGSLGDFLQQIPSGVLASLCGSGLLLVVSFFMIARQRALRAQGITPGGIEMGVMMKWFKRDKNADSGDFPDIDMLLGGDITPLPAHHTAPPKRSRTGTYDVELPDGRTVEAAEMFIVARDLADGSLIIQIGDRAYSHPSQIEDPEARRRFMNTLKQLVQFATAPAPSQPASEVSMPPAPAETRETSGETGQDDDLPSFDALMPTSQPAAAPRKAPPPRVDGVMPGDLPKFSTDSLPMPMRGKPMPKVEIPEINIAGAIEAYLQHKIGYTPQFAGRGIHVRPAFGGGVKIEVDGMFFDAVDEVSDQEVRQFLTETIQEWQSRQ